MNMQPHRYKIFLDLDREDGKAEGSLEFTIQGTRKDIVRFLNQKGYESSHFTLEKLPPLVTLKAFKKIVHRILT